MKLKKPLNLLPPIFRNAPTNSTPTTQPKSDEQYIPPNILDKIREKRDLRELWQQNRCPDKKKYILNHKIRDLKFLLDQN